MHRDAKNVWKKLKERNQRRELAVLGIHRVRNKETFCRISLVLPKNINTVFLKNNKNSIGSLYVYDSVYSYLVNLNLEKIMTIRYYADANAVIINWAARFNFFDVGFAHIYKMIRIFYTMFVKRLRVRGRLYRIYKRNIYRDLQYRFGHTHKMTVYTEGIYVKYIRKKRIRLFGYDFQYLSEKSREARDVFPLNVYTRRGIRLGGELSRARIGKVVKYY